MTAYYNEFDPFAVAWLRELIKDGLIADGIVDDRSILEVTPNDLKGFQQHHFFAGIGGWSYAARLAGWPDARAICTASLPCQPFSVAGAGLGKDDERHLLPHFLELVRACRFPVIMGEQVEGAVRHGWLDDLHTAMEAEGYTTDAVVLGAHSVNAPHQRQRIYWVADANSGDRRWEQGLRKQPEGNQLRQPTGDCGAIGNIMANPRSERLERGELTRENAGQNGERGTGTLGATTQRSGDNSKLIYCYCRDGKYRPIPKAQSCLQSMVNGVPDGLDALWAESLQAFPLIQGQIPNRAAILKGAGNAIVPQVAAQVMRAYMND